VPLGLGVLLERVRYRDCFAGKILTTHRSNRRIGTLEIVETDETKATTGFLIMCDLFLKEENREY
jgi:hypothetical protein